MAADKMIIDGFVFESEEEALEAKNEYDGVQYMKGRTNMSNPVNVYSVYKNVVEKKLFKTPVGMQYLYELRQTLLKSGQYTEEDLNTLSIPVQASVKGTQVKTVHKEKAKLSRSDVIRNMKKYDIESVYRNRFINSIIVNIILIIVLIAFIAIANNSNNTNILNYKARIDAEYSEKEDTLAQWKSQLELKELELKKHEAELDKATE